MDLSDVEETYQRYVKTKYDFDFDLKSKQIQIIHSVLCKQTTFGLLPTGYGKSMCYIMPPLIMDELNWEKTHTALVISPLKALIKDQVQTLETQGVSAAFIGGDMDVDIKDLETGQYSVLFASPEIASVSKWRRFLQNVYMDKLCLLCFDEAHCISEWGEDFRPAYKTASMLRSIFDVPFLMLTATCTEKIQTDIFRIMSVYKEDVKKIAEVPDRPNIAIDLRKTKDDLELLEWLIKYLIHEKTDALKTIVYCRSISVVSELFCQFMERLQNEHIDTSVQTRIVEMFHRNIDKDSSRRIMEEFSKPTSHLRCLITTIAFGMGIQIPDIRIIVHWGAPKSVLSYWQEVGRAGRDGKQALAVCYAYGRSLDKRRTDQDMKDIVNMSNCVRVRILRQLSVDGMDTKGIDRMEQKPFCSGRCKSVCKCSMCLCCAVCFSKCTCTRKAGEFSELAIGISI